MASSDPGSDRDSPPATDVPPGNLPPLPPRDVPVHSHPLQSLSPRDVPRPLQSVHPNVPPRQHTSRLTFLRPPTPYNPDFSDTYYQPPPAVSSIPSIPKLSSKNYRTWITNIELVLHRHQVWSFVCDVLLLTNDPTLGMRKTFLLGRKFCGHVNLMFRVHFHNVPPLENAGTL